MSHSPRSPESLLMRIWMRRSLPAMALWPISLLFRALVTFRRGLYALGLLGSSRLPVPVVVVGNIFVGGTGKTPLVIWLALALRKAGFTPGIISRGYGAKHAQPTLVSTTSPPQQVGDEPLLMAQRTACPIMVGRDRVAAGTALLAAHPDVDIVISDDGLQHYALERDVEIVLFDDRGIGNGWMLPAGPLREPPSRRRDITIVNGSRVPEEAGDVVFMQLVGEVAEKFDDRSHKVSLTDLPNHAKETIGHIPRLLAAAGIGNPGRFFDLLRKAKLSFEELPLPDHFDYKISPFINKDADIILITEKDAVKCALFEPSEVIRRLWVVPVTAHLDSALTERIVERCRGSRIA